LLHVDPESPDHVAARIVEVEAYLGRSDPASHAFRGPTPRAAIMFGEPGHLYVYLSYGLHHCANVVTEREGEAGAVLLRACEVVAGEQVVRRRRGRVPWSQLLRGPGNLCRGLGIDRLDNGTDLCDARGRLHITATADRPEVVAAPRVGVTQAHDLPLRFALARHIAVSAPVPRSAVSESST
jgi:DNA-3-methyladenine glycosylase